MDPLIENEMSVLGGCLLDPAALDRALSSLTAKDFVTEQHRLIFQALRQLAEANHPIDLVTVTSELNHGGILAKAGGSQYLAALVDFVPTAANSAYYIQHVLTASQRRQLAGVGREILRKTETGSESIGDIIERAEDAVQTIRKPQANAPVHISTVVGPVFKALTQVGDHPSASQGLGTGIPLLDRMLSGLRPKKLHVIAGRPAMGKTALATNMAFHIALSDQPVPVLLFSLEMGKDEVAERALCTLGRVDSGRARLGKMTNEDHSRLSATGDRIYRAPVYVDDTPALSVSELRTRARGMKRAQGIGLIVVDYLQLMRGKNHKGGNREQEVAEISRGLKQLAMELDLPVVALSQLNRSLENRTDKRPIMADLRESGSIEQDADVVMFIHRDHVYDPRADPTVAELIVAKNRSGPLGKVPLTWTAEFTHFNPKQ